MSKTSELSEPSGSLGTKFKINSLFIFHEGPSNFIAMSLKLEPGQIL